MKAIKFLSSLASATAFVTIVWVVWALQTPGDYLANANPLFGPSLFAAVLIGGVIGWRASRKLQPLLFALASAALCYWLFVPSGWWAHVP